MHEETETREEQQGVTVDAVIAETARLVEMLGGDDVDKAKIAEAAVLGAIETMSDESKAELRDDLAPIWAGALRMKLLDAVGEYPLKTAAALIESNDELVASGDYIPDEDWVDPSDVLRMLVTMNDFLRAVIAMADANQYAKAKARGVDIPEHVVARQEQP